jgi:hypothetical protein
MSLKLLSTVGTVMVSGSVMVHAQSKLSELPQARVLSHAASIGNRMVPPRRPDRDP